jgi:hypothetical protein
VPALVRNIARFGRGTVLEGINPGVLLPKRLRENAPACNRPCWTNVVGLRFQGCGLALPYLMAKPNAIRRAAITPGIHLYRQEGLGVVHVLRPNALQHYCVELSAMRKDRQPCT